MSAFTPSTESGIFGNFKKQLQVTLMTTAYLMCFTKNTKLTYYLYFAINTSFKRVGNLWILKTTFRW